jgi:hypothetical protein
MFVECRKYSVITKNDVRNTHRLHTDTHTHLQVKQILIKFRELFGESRPWSLNYPVLVFTTKKNDYIPAAGRSMFFCVVNKLYMSVINCTCNMSSTEFSLRGPFHQHLFFIRNRDQSETFVFRHRHMHRVLARYKKESLHRVAKMMKNIT